MLTSEDSRTILLNPANLDRLNNIDLKIDLDNSISLNGDTLDFVDSLITSSNNAQKVSNLMKKNIGKTLSFSENSFISIYKAQDSFSWLLGLYSDIDGYFITHSGFGSVGAMESFIERYSSIISSFALQKDSFRYGLNIKAIEKYQTIHNYTIGEIIDNNILDYFNNRYRENQKAVGFDIGLIYQLLNSKIGLSLLDIGDTDFKELGSIPSTTNIAFSKNYNSFLFNIDYIDIFQAKKFSSFKESISFGVSKSFLDNRLTLNSAILHQNLLFGIDYIFSIAHISLSTYRDIEYNGVKNRKYQLSISLNW